LRYVALACKGTLALSDNGKCWGCCDVQDYFREQREVETFRDKTTAVMK